MPQTPQQNMRRGHSQPHPSESALKLTHKVHASYKGDELWAHIQLTDSMKPKTHPFHNLCVLQSPNEGTVAVNVEVALTHKCLRGAYANDDGTVSLADITPSISIKCCCCCYCGCCGTKLGRRKMTGGSKPTPSMEEDGATIVAKEDLSGVNGWDCT
ncbi:unnamed protein product [Taenia asiatica]|uniref:Uncharacterized protein n=1 Tax=Taenia asiatica TaxID=60517 RepID=A0A0R3VY01_TAEAS|nr:unnamed protein product [Taenia asiatica]